MAASTQKAGERAMSRKVRKGHGSRRSQAPKRTRKSSRRTMRRAGARQRAHDTHEQRIPTAETLDVTARWSTATTFFDSDGSSDDGVWSQRNRTAVSDDSDKASFLSKYFRDMSALEVLRPEEEAVAARRIEELEIVVWEQVFSYPPIVEHLIRVIEKNIEKPPGDFRALRNAANETRRSNAKSIRRKLAREARNCGARLHGLDVDRIAAQAVVAELELVKNGEASTFEGSGRLRFSSKSRLFIEYRERVRTADRAAAEARNDFVRANLRLVVSIARRFNHGRMALADLIQEGNIGLMKAVERYDYRRGFRFSTYASWWIRHAISRALADKGREVRLPVHMLDAHHKLSKARRELTAKLGRKPTNEELSYACDMPADKIEKMRGYLTDRSYSLDRPVNDDDGRSLIEFLDDPEYDDDAVTDDLNIHALAQAMRGALQELKPIEADILKQRFGLDTYHEHTLKQIGEKYNLSRERIRQLQEQALDKVRTLMRERRLSM